MAEIKRGYEMNKIIKGKRYNTDTAEMIVKREGESLYRKQTGEFFLCLSGKEIKPLTQEKAEKWVEECCTISVYEELFNKSEEEKTRITVHLSLANADKVKRLAVERKISLSEMIERLVENF